MKVVLAHDYLTQRGGAERLTLTLTKIFEGSKLYTSVFSPSKTFDGFRHVDIATTLLQRIPLARLDPRVAMVAMPAAWRTLKVERDAQVAICSSTGWSHALRVPEGCRKIVYCHNPARWIYQTSEYVRGRGTRVAFAPLRRSLERWDKRMASTADLYVVNSRQVAERVWRAYGIEAKVLHPPVMIDVNGAREKVRGLDPGYWLVVARGRSYKNVGAVIEAFGELPDERLVIVGNDARESVYVGNVCQLGIVTDGQLRWLYENARALIGVTVEDFGLTPLEANIFGTPVAVLRAGGYVESTAEGVSGVFIDTTSVKSIGHVVRSFPDLPRAAVRAHAVEFNIEQFSQQMWNIVRGR